MAKSQHPRRSQVLSGIDNALMPLDCYANKSEGEKKGEAGSEAAPVAAVQKARKVQKKVVKGVHGTRVKKVGCI